MRTYGTCAFGVRAPIIRPGDDLVSIVADSVLATVEERNKYIEKKKSIYNWYHSLNGFIKKLET